MSNKTSCARLAGCPPPASVMVVRGRPAGRPWTTRDITSNRGNTPTPEFNWVAGGPTETGYPGSPRFLMSGEPRFLKALR
jgi:hypothetical protein